MGFESFRVELRGGRTQYSEADQEIRRLPHVHGDQNSIPLRGSTYYLMTNGNHVIELELMDSPVRLSCRFTLCHPPSIDSTFLGFVRELMERLGMEVTICDAVRPEHAHPFCLGDFANFMAITSECIATRRAEWVAMFGTETLAATTNEVHERIILPRCKPGLAQTM